MSEPTTPEYRGPIREVVDAALPFYDPKAAKTFWTQGGEEVFSTDPGDVHLGERYAIYVSREQYRLRAAIDALNTRV